MIVVPPLHQQGVPLAVSSSFFWSLRREDVFERHHTGNYVELKLIFPPGRLACRLARRAKVAVLCPDTSVKSCSAVRGCTP